MGGAETIFTNVEDSTTAGRQTTVLGDVLQGGGAGGSSILVGYVGADPLHGKGPGKLPAQVFQEYHRDAAGAIGGWGLGYLLL